MILAYLWKERKQNPVGSYEWFKSWAKRIIQAKNVAVILWNNHCLQNAGAQIGNLTLIYAELNGSKKNLVVGDGCAIGKAHFALHAPLIIGNNVSINDNVTILTATHNLADPEWKMFRKEIHIDDYAWIAMGAMLLPGVHIGRGAVVGAGAVVAKDVAPYTIVAGNPASPTHTKRTQVLDYSPAGFMAPFEAWLGTTTRPKTW